MIVESCDFSRRWQRSGRIMVAQSVLAPEQYLGVECGSGLSSPIKPQEQVSSERQRNSGKTRSGNESQLWDGRQSFSTLILRAGIQLTLSRPLLRKSTRFVHPLAVSYFKKDGTNCTAYQYRTCYNYYLQRFGPWRHDQHVVASCCKYSDHHGVEVVLKKKGQDIMNAIDFWMQSYLSQKTSIPHRVKHRKSSARYSG